MSDPLNPDASESISSPSPVMGEIPSAVRSGTHRNTAIFIGVAGASLLFLFVLKGNRSKSTPAEVVNASGIQNALPSPALQALAAPPVVESQPTIAQPSLRDIRRTSPILIYNNTANTPTATTSGESTGPDVPMPAGFHPTSAVSSHATRLGDRTFIIAQGKMIDAVLETAINTDHPGMLRALVSENIYGDTGHVVLLPRGSRLIGQYDAAVAQGQDRVFVIWQRVIRPDGVDITLDSGGTDPLGESGLDGAVHRHFFTMFGAATLLSMMGAASATVGVQPQDNANSLAAYRSSVAQGFNEAANSVLSVFVRIKPTITVKQGVAMKVFVARDLYFDPSLLPGVRVQVIP